ncbi:MAG: DUF2587 domain-containing protein [bacterium]|nr:DUF2587 domain-containing protein [bacterium]MXV90006.1 DUF2587 domain-containing protein [Acidimicrobiia bacterium]MYC46564.1 DUF2587 domain-containing protein [Acidimicrobiia bacterium]MYI20714.1 DUF2587 domain-containing protein [Acidimicrobiia bacterium]MYI56918.1 DUF2587 domain-containing protein [Acidimicrobiia bacterium]
MTSDSEHSPTEPERAEIVAPEDATEPQGDAIEQPAKVMRVGAMLRGLLEEVREAPLDERSRDRLREIYEISLQELGSAVSADLREELERLAQPFPDAEVPTEAELRIAKAQLVGWMEGLIQGIQATLYAQQVLARRQLADMRGQLPPFRGADEQRPAEERPGTYL